MLVIPGILIVSEELAVYYCHVLPRMAEVWLLQSFPTGSLLFFLSDAQTGLFVSKMTQLK